MNTEKSAVDLAGQVAQALRTAGLNLADDDTPPTPNGWQPSGVGVRPAKVDGEWVVMLTWGMSDDADYRTVDIMLTAVAEVLRVHGFAVERHPIGAAYLVSGRS